MTDEHGDAGRSLYAAVLKASGLHPVVAPFTVRRLLLRVGVLNVDTLTRADLLRALPHFQAELPKYLADPKEHEAALAALAKLAGSPRE